LGEEYCRFYAARSTMRCVSIRPLSVYGPNQDLSTGYIGQLIDGWLLGQPVRLSGHPRFLRDFVHIDDVVDVCLGAATTSCEYDVINAGSGQATSLRSLVAEFASLCGDSLEVEYAPPSPGTIERALADVTHPAGPRPSSQAARRRSARHHRLLPVDEEGCYLTPWWRSSSLRASAPGSGTRCRS
jgi:UDP-glucose 4-epimerase